MVDNDREKHEAELTFSEAMLSDIATDLAKVRRNTGFVAGVLLGYLTLIALLFFFNIVANSS
jgi:hypothetical protein